MCCTLGNYVVEDKKVSLHMINLALLRHKNLLNPVFFFARLFYFFSSDLELW